MEFATEPLTGKDQNIVVVFTSKRISIFCNMCAHSTSFKKFSLAFQTKPRMVLNKHCMIVCMIVWIYFTDQMWYKCEISTPTHPILKR